MPEYTIVNHGINNPDLVKALKTLLNATNLYPRDVLPIDDTLDRKTLNRALEVSTLYTYGDTYGKVGTRFFVNLTNRVKAVLLSDATVLAALPAWIMKIACGATGNGLSGECFDMEMFLGMYSENFHEYIPAGNDWARNLQRFVNFIFADSRVTDRRVASYIMATAMHEGRAAADKWKATWNPVSETGGEGKDYGQLETVADWDHVPIDANGNRIDPISDSNEIKKLAGKLIAVHDAAKRKDVYYPKSSAIQRRYYGRGYVQITFQANYRAMDEAFKLNNNLLIDPELAARDAQLSYNISSYGICNGSFSGSKRRVIGQGYVGGYKIADYVNDTKTDYFNAREIVNGDKNKVEKGRTKSNGRLVAGYCETFQAMFDATLN